MSELRVLLVDDHELVRMGLRSLLEDVNDLRIVGEAGTAAEAIKSADFYQPDVIIMDIRLSDQSGIDATRTIIARWPKIQIIMLTSYADDHLIADAIAAGAVGYVLKQVGSEELLRALDAVRQGAALLDPTITRRVLAMIRQRNTSDQDPFHDLTDREVEILKELAKGKTNLQIAESLYLSEKTVRNQISTILNKLAVANRVEAATLAVQLRIDDYNR